MTRARVGSGDLTNAARSVTLRVMANDRRPTTSPHAAMPCPTCVLAVPCLWGVLSRSFDQKAVAT